MDEETTIVSRVLGPVERVIYRLLRIDPEENMSRKKYLAAALFFNLQGKGYVPLVRNALKRNSPDLRIRAVCFVHRAAGRSLFPWG
ncbi:MAG: potassium-transporting ATPase subunit KdpA [Candidatus Limivicinus sp.]